jgi:large subunit ribosomal protein L13
MIIIDAKNKSLGRVASQAARHLSGKMSPAFYPRLLPPAAVKIINASKAKISGKKMNQKFYKRYSGYPGGLKLISLKKILEKDKKAVFKKAVRGMLAKNKLRDKILKNLIIED